MKPKHTPGPWGVVTPIKPLCFQITADEGSFTVATLEGVQTVDKINARLIAAAPEMLEAIYLARAVVARVGDGGAALRAIDAAIAKAEG